MLLSDHLLLTVCPARGVGGLQADGPWSHSGSLTIRQAIDFTWESRQQVGFSSPLASLLGPKSLQGPREGLENDEADGHDQSANLTAHLCLSAPGPWGFHFLGFFPCVGRGHLLILFLPSLTEV